VIKERTSFFILKLPKLIADGLDSLVHEFVDDLFASVFVRIAFVANYRELPESLEQLDVLTHS
jgi:hypothetical protein